jgi:acetyl-CoA decarbonylase/synthase complex subunit gamma
MPWVAGTLKTNAGPVPRVYAKLTAADRVGGWRVRWCIGRRRYRVPPGLYAVNNPNPDSIVCVTANYKLSFDRLRSSLKGLDAWILVLDTKGINVWCAAGKKTFGTDELVRRLADMQLARVVTHGALLLPQLGATGVAANEVHRQSGFRVVYGPVRAEDIPAFLEAGGKASREMRRVRFGFRDRLVLVPAELVPAARYVFPAALLVTAAAGLGPGGYAVADAARVGLWGAAALVAGWIAGACLGPVLLPYLPGRSFSVKGGAAGLAVTALLLALPPVRALPPPALAAVCLAVPAVASFLTMNFTGSSTYTSPSGVRREMKRYVPVQFACALAATGLWTWGTVFV